MENSKINEAGDAELLQEKEQKIKSTELESSDEEENEEIVLDEASDTENYEPPEELSDEEDPSSGEEEVGVKVERTGFCKLKFDDVEQKREEYLKSLELLQESLNSSQEEDNEERKPDNFTDYRNLIEADMSDYNSGDDENFNPVYCGQTLSDIEYNESDERDTESENEIENQDSVDKKTGETLKCLRMIENLEIPPSTNMKPNPKDPQKSENTENISQMECS